MVFLLSIRQLKFISKTILTNLNIFAIIHKSRAGHRMKICIFETQHFEGAYPVIKLFDLPSNQITVITSPEAYERFEELLENDLKKYEWIILPKKKSMFFRQFYRNLKRVKPDLLYLNTVSDN